MADGGLNRAAAPPAGRPARPDPRDALGRMGSFDWDLHGGWIDLDPAALLVLGLSPEEYDGRAETVTRGIPPDEVARLRTLLGLAVRSGADAFGAYYRMRVPRGGVRRLHSQAHIRYDRLGRPTRIVGVVREADPHTPWPGAPVGSDSCALTGVTARVTALLEHAVTVGDVTAVLEDRQVLDYLQAAGMVLGVVHGTRIRVLAHPSIGAPLPVFERPNLEESLPLATTVTTQRPQFVHSPAQFREEYPTMWAGMEPYPVGAGAYLPLVAQGRIIGVLAVLYRRARDFSQHERNLLVTLGSSIAQSLQRAMLSGQEHDLAESLQQAMLPRRIPAVPGADIAVRYRSARLGRSVGGDWYDVIPLPGDRVGVAVGDVQGHDTEAAAVMGQLRVVLSAYVAEGHPPATAMARASAFLQELDTDRFATCTYVQANLATGGLHVVRAGHLDALVRARDGTCRWVGSEGGLPLGLSAEFAGPGAIDYPVTRFTLLPGETLLLFTDGLVELPGTDLGQRMAVLSDVVRSGPVEVDALADRLVDVVGAQNAGDDMALLLMRRMGLPAARAAA